jgi:hypothetical protein
MDFAKIYDNFIKRKTRKKIEMRTLADFRPNAKFTLPKLPFGKR